MHKGDTIPGLITAIFGYSVAIYTLLEDTMRVNAQSSDGVPVRASSQCCWALLWAF